MNCVRPIAVARVSLPIRRPRREVYLAFTDIDMLTRFWPAQVLDGEIATGATSAWQMGVDDTPIVVTCAEAREDTLIRLEFSNGVKVMLTFDRFEDGGTVVHFCQCGFGGAATSDEVAAANRAAAQMLSKLRRLLEPGADADRFRLPRAA
ncbi:SRPBCC domain-containing protein [Pseudooceanicola sp. C21-150M6]|uniref:SRPBCC domain-containing protein n=1 Tax=Pseudooceanicola sp. C21-150M6 TaxID=3434355 RepID=UPI003D7FF5DB